MPPPNEHTSEGGRDDRKQDEIQLSPLDLFPPVAEADAGRTLISHFRPTERQRQINEESMGDYDNSHQN